MITSVGVEDDWMILEELAERKTAVRQVFLEQDLGKEVFQEKINNFLEKLQQPLKQFKNYSKHPKL